jgi:hypothetical protein
MSLQEILVLALFVGVPLIQLLTRLLKQGTGQKVPLPPLPTPRPEVRRQPVVRHPNPPPAPKAPLVVNRPAPATVQRSRSQGAMSVGLRNPQELRRAISLATILGPCRATRPHTWSSGA